MTRSWTAAVNGNWSNAGNWSPAGVPSAGDDLVFPAATPNHSMTNDLAPGTSVGAMSFDNGYALAGNALTVTGNIIATNSPTHISAPLTLGAALSMDSLFIDGSIDIHGQTVSARSVYFNGPLNGTGVIMNANNPPEAGKIYVNGGGNYSGSIVNGPGGAGFVQVTGSLPNASFTIAYFYANGNVTVGDVSIVGGYISVGDQGGNLHTRSFTLTNAVVVVIYRGVPLIQATGTVTLNSGTLDLATSLTIGSQYTIFDNDGTDPVIGTLTTLPEGAESSSFGNAYRISYAGGDGNDVIITALQPTSTSVMQSNASTQFGEPVMLTATVVSGAGTPTGSVTFTSDGVSLGTAPVQNGMATLTVSNLEPGTHALGAVLHGTGVYADSTSPTVQHDVARLATTLSIATDHPTSKVGDPVQFTAIVGGALSGVPAAGNVTFAADGVTIGTAAVVNGTAMFVTSMFHAGVRSITAAYGGDTHYLPSNAPAIQQIVSKGSTAVDARLRNPLLVGEVPTMSIAVTPAGNPPFSPTGTVSVREGDVLLGTQTLDHGAARLTLPPLAQGEHKLTISYAGDVDFEPSDVTIPETIVAPGISVIGAHVVEGNSGITVITVPVTLSSPLAVTARVSFTTIAGTATEGVDYEKASGVIEFAPGEQTKSIELHIVGDRLFEEDETFSVVLSDPVNAAIGTASAVVVIENDDSLPGRHRPARH